MTAKVVIPRAVARRDVEKAIRYYAREAGMHVALGFIDDLEKAYRLIADYPSSGSLRYAYELRLPNLRCRQLKQYPYLIVYIVRAEYVDVWRVLHGKRDIPAWLQDPAE